MGVALLFIDGVGIGRRDPGINPLARSGYLLSQFGDGSGEPLPRGGVLRALDTSFGVPGRPQSATNQTAMLTGRPAPRLLGKHLLGYPNPPLAAILEEHSIVLRMRRAGRSATFANAYPAAYLDALGLPRRSGPPLGSLEFPERWRRRLRPSATTLAMRAASIPLRTFEDAWAGEAITNDLSGARARVRGLDAPERTPEEAADIFLRLCATHDFVLFEHYLADEAGHARDGDAAELALTTFDRFARRVVENKGDDLHVLVTSDHGNVEDLSTRSHTLHPVPVLYFGQSPEQVERIETVADVGTSILQLLGVEP